MNPNEKSAELYSKFGNLAIDVVNEIIATRPQRSPLTSDCVHSLNYWKQVKSHLTIIYPS